MERKRGPGYLEEEHAQNRGERKEDVGGQEVTGRAEDVCSTYRGLTAVGRAGASEVRAMCMYVAGGEQRTRWGQALEYWCEVRTGEDRSVRPNTVS